MNSSDLLVPLALLGASSRDVVWLADLSAQRLLYVNASFERLWGREAAALIDDPTLWNTAVHPEDVSVLPRPFFDDPDATRVREYRIRGAAGQTLWLQDRRFRLSAGQDGVDCIGGFVQDITADRQQQLEQTGRMELATITRDEALALAREQDEFASLVSHELRSPLNAIRGWVHMLSRAGDLNGMQTRAVEAIERSIHAQARLLDDLRDHRALLTPAAPLEAVPCDVGELLQESITRVKASTDLKRIHVEVSVAPDVGQVRADTRRMVRALGGLLAHLVSLALEDGLLYISVERRVNAIVIQADCGPVRAGSPRLQPPEPSGVATFSTRSQLLAIEMARRVLAVHGGRVTALQDSDPSALAFTVELPLMGQPVAPLAPARPLVQPDLPLASWGSLGARAHRLLADLRVIIIDDDTTTRAMLHALLREARAVPVNFDTAQGAFEYLSNLSNERQPHLVISDLRMPGEDGYSFMRRLRALELRTPRRRLPSIAFSSATRPDDRLRSLQAGYDAHLDKPLNNEVLLNTLASVLQEAPAPARKA